MLTFMIPLPGTGSNIRKVNMNSGQQKCGLAELLALSHSEFDTQIKEMSLKDLLDTISTLQKEMSKEQENFNSLSAELSSLNKKSQQYKQISKEMTESQARLTALMDRSMKCFQQVNYQTIQNVEKKIVHKSSSNAKTQKPIDRRKYDMTAILTSENLIDSLFLLIAAAFSLGANFGWFIGLIISILLIIALAVLIYLMYKRRPEPQKQRPYTAPPRRRANDGYGDDRSDREYHDDDGGFNRDDDYDRRRDDDYDKKGYEGDRYDDYDRRGYNDSYDKQYDNDDYDRRDDDYDRRDDDYDRREDDYDDRRRDDDYDDRGRYDDRDRRYDDDYEDEKRRYSDHSDKDRYGDDDKDYEPYSRRPDYDRTPSYDNRPPSYGEEVDIREPNKFDADGYPIDTTPQTPKTPGTSSFV
ncbi:unnamed protein product [Mytilus edulis]|uniref:Uncharacterized protein n=1 Tax=Mytilus edulis TaxID=6550 RepID=A0A8S3RV71_MYTED|nr:unnamed protein product [Mytilus edulis]